MRIRKNIKQLENVIRGMVSEAKADDVRQEIEAAYNQIKVVKEKLKGLGNTNKKNQKLKNAMRGMVDELEDLEDLDMEEEVSEEDEELVRKNEQSEGHGTWQGLGMKENVVKLKESDMNYIFKQVLNESVTCYINNGNDDCGTVGDGYWDEIQVANSNMCRGMGGQSGAPNPCGVGGDGGWDEEWRETEERTIGRVPCCPPTMQTDGTVVDCCESDTRGKSGCPQIAYCYTGTWNPATCSCEDDWNQSTRY